jgi:molybdopterin/thiamine biosynthesis adenylyltransferase
LGPAFDEDLSQLRIAVVGCGGTGSATAGLLARLGVRFLGLFDEDVVHETNLNRLHFATAADAKMERYKVDVVADGINGMNLGTQVKVYHHWVSSVECREALKGCDIIFGCTDDNAGRLFLNRFAYFYNVPLIDMGLAIDVGNGDPPRVNAFDGRVTVIQPGAACLLCREIIDPVRAREESLKRANPDEYEKQKTEAYVSGEGNPSPAVVPFTTGLATMAVEELIHRLQGFRGANGSIEQRLRKFHLLTDRRQSYEPSPDCPICGSQNYWSRGDVEPFLDSTA